MVALASSREGHDDASLAELDDVGVTKGDG
jgi:hypothetical protein